MQYVGRGLETAKDRHEALVDLVPIVESLNLPDIRNRTRRPIRIGIPDDLDVAIRRVADSTGQTYVDILVAAVSEYRKKHPISPER